MSVERDRARLAVDEARARWSSTLAEARVRLAPRALAAEGAEVVATRAARMAAHARPSARFTRVLGTAAALSAIGAAVVLRLAQARAAMKHDGSLSVDGKTPINPT